MVEKWIQTAHLKKGTLSRELGIPIQINIPTKLLIKLQTTPVTTTIRNLSGVGYRVLKITPKMKKQATLALTLKRVGRGNGKSRVQR